MNKRYVLIAGFAMAIAAQPVLAQHQHGGEPSGGGGHSDAGGSVPENNRAISDFQKAIVVQATEEQSSHLRSWIQDTAALNQQLEVIRLLSESNDPGGFSSELETFKAALESENLVGHNFLAYLSGPQRSGLKNPVRKLDGANSALAKALAELTHASGNAQNGKLLAKELQKAKKAITTEQQEQQRLALEMGVTG
jgi:hypothetical protein